VEVGVAVRQGSWGRKNGSCGWETGWKGKTGRARKERQGRYIMNDTVFEFLFYFILFSFLWEAG